MERKIAKQLQTDITHLSSDELQGHKADTQDEQKTGDYIVQRYTQEGVGPYKGQYRYPFHFTYGKEIAATTQISINTTPVRINDNAFPLPFSANKHVSTEVLPDVMEQGNIWLIPVYSGLEQANDPHFQPEKYMFEHAREAAAQGASGVIFFDSYGSYQQAQTLSFNKLSEYTPLAIPVMYLAYPAYRDYVANQKGSLSIDLNISINKAVRTGENIAAYIDNGEPYTVMLGAHYGHPGYGEDDPNTLKEHLINPGANGTGSSTAALLEIAKWAKRNKKLRHYNYMFINFSGKEGDLYGSESFVRDQHIDSAHTAYMINIDMIGTLNDSTHALTMLGVSTSPAWGEAVKMAGDDFKLTINSSGIGPSGYASFYNAGIPALLFFTDATKDYHTPGNKASSVNYQGEVRVIQYIESIIARLDKENTKPVFAYPQ